MTDHAHRRKRVIVLTVSRPSADGSGGFSRRNRTPSGQARVSTLASPTSTLWFRATAATVLAIALFAQIGHARADGSLITTSVQVSLKIQQSCQIDSTDAAAVAAAGSGVEVASAASRTVAAAAVPSGTAAASATTLASAGASQGSDAAPKVSCQFDEPYGMLSSNLSDPTGRLVSGAAVNPDGTFQVASFWTVLF